MADFIDFMIKFTVSGKLKKVKKKKIKKKKKKMDIHSRFYEKHATAFVLNLKKLQ